MQALRIYFVRHSKRDESLDAGCGAIPERQGPSVVREMALRFRDAGHPRDSHQPVRPAVQTAEILSEAIRTTRSRREPAAFPRFDIVKLNDVLEDSPSERISPSSDTSRTGRHSPFLLSLPKGTRCARAPSRPRSDGRGAPIRARLAWPYGIAGSRTRMLVRKVLHTPHAVVRYLRFEPLDLKTLPAFQVPSSRSDRKPFVPNITPNLRRKRKTMPFNNSVYPGAPPAVQECATDPTPSRKGDSPSPGEGPARLRQTGTGRRRLRAADPSPPRRCDPIRRGGARPVAHPHPTGSWPSRSGQFGDYGRHNRNAAPPSSTAASARDPEQALQKGRHPRRHAGASPRPDGQKLVNLSTVEIFVLDEATGCWTWLHRRHPPIIEKLPANGRR